MIFCLYEFVMNKDTTTNLEVSKSTEEDQNAILTLLEKSKGLNLSKEERAKQGFVQGVMDKGLLTAFQNGLGVYIIKENQKVIAFAFASKAGIMEKGPIVEAMNVVRNELEGLSTSNIFLYGPVAVEAAFKGLGLLTKMLVRICTDVSKDFEWGLAFVDAENLLSTSIHEHYFGEATATFLYDNRKYFAYLFDPKVIIANYSGR